MERCAWKAIINPGKKDEYIKRHAEIWPEMTNALNQAGITNYTIWNINDELFGYYECESLEYATKFQQESEIVKRWEESMKSLTCMIADERMDPETALKCVFLHTNK